MARKGDKNPRTTEGQCPICGRVTAIGYRPFCSRRCADVDLGRWLKGDYAIPTEEEAAVAVDDRSEDR